MGWAEVGVAVSGFRGWVYGSGLMGGGGEWEQQIAPLRCEMTKKRDQQQRLWLVECIDPTLRKVREGWGTRSALTGGGE